MGLFFYMHKALVECADLDVKVIGEQYHRAHLQKKLCYLLAKLLPAAWIGDYLFRVFLRDVEKDILANTDVDFIVAPVASKILTKLKRSECLPPILFITDATPSYLIEGYGVAIADARIEQETKVLSLSRVAIYSSHFMADRSRDEFFAVLGSDASRLAVVPFGLNVDGIPVFSQPKCIGSTLELLFIGKWWERKGGDIAVEALRQLTRRGIACKLTIIGCRPPVDDLPANVEVIPYLDKNNESEYDRFIQIQRRSHLLILPTRADCTPMVIAEANAFGSPVVVTNVGGLGTLVRDGHNGYLLPLSAVANDYADLIERIFEQPGLYEKLSQSSREMFESTLNWTAWANQIQQIGRKVNIETTASECQNTEAKK